VAIANGYATLAQIKSALRIPSADATDDGLLEMAVESASRLIDAYCSRNFIYGGTAATTRYFHADDPYVVQIDDARSITQVQTSSSEDGIYDVTWDLTAHTGDIQAEPLNDYVGGLTWPYTRLRAIGDYVFPVDRETTVKVTAVYGWPTVPITVAQACILQSSRIFTRLQSPLGVAGFGDMGIMRVSRGLDPDVAQLIEGYRRFRGVA
jgi:hypothetical protein